MWLTAEGVSYVRYYSTKRFARILSGVANPQGGVQLFAYGVGPNNNRVVKPITLPKLMGLWNRQGGLFAPFLTARIAAARGTLLMLRLKVVDRPNLVASVRQTNYQGTATRTPKGDVIYTRSGTGRAGQGKAGQGRGKLLLVRADTLYYFVRASEEEKEELTTTLPNAGKVQARAKGFLAATHPLGLGLFFFFAKLQHQLSFDDSSTNIEYPLFNSVGTLN